MCKSIYLKENSPAWYKYNRSMCVGNSEYRPNGAKYKSMLWGVRYNNLDQEIR